MGYNSPYKNNRRRQSALQKILLWSIFLISLAVIIGVAIALMTKSGDTAGDNDSKGESANVASQTTATTTMTTTAEPETVTVNYGSPDFDLNCKIAYVVDASSDQVIFKNNSSQKTAPASLTKIVTAMVALQNCEDADKEQVSVDADSIRAVTDRGASVAGLAAGEKYTLRDLLNVMMVRSACDAAQVIATHMGEGDPSKFVDMMNELVKDLGCKDTVFKNSHGLDEEGQYTTAEDMYLITKKALTIPEFKKLSSLKECSLPAQGSRERLKFKTTNMLLEESSPYYYKYAQGVKTGSTSQAGRCIIASAEKGDKTFISVLMKAPFSTEDVEEKLFAAIIDAKNIFEWIDEAA